VRLRNRTAALVCALAVLLAGRAGAAAPGQGGPHPPPAAESRGDEGGRGASVPRPLELLAGVAGLEGQMVREVRFESASPLAPARLAELLVQKQGEPFAREKVRQSLHALYGTGRYADIRVEAEQRPQNEITLIFIAEENFFVGAVTVEGVRRPPTEGQLLNASRLRLGELFTEDRLQQGVERMQRVLRDNGYYRAVIAEDRVYDREKQQVDVHFRITVRGTPGLSEYEVQQRARLRPGDRVTLARQTNALQRLRSYYQKQDRLEAQVAVSEREYDPAANTLHYELLIERGPVVDIVVEGARLRRGLVRRYIPVFEEAAVDDDLLQEGRRNLRDYFQSQGYFHVDVDFRQVDQPEEDRRRILYTVDRGERHKLDEIVIEGNQFFGDDLIRERLVMQTAGVVLSHGRFSESILARDIEAVEGLYRASGFQQVTVRSEVQDNYGGRSGRMRVVLKVDEGPQTRVASLTITGHDALRDDDVWYRMSIAEGQAYSDFALASDRDVIVSHYYNRGFPNAVFDWAVEPDGDDPTRMHVTYNIREGERFFVDRVLVSGYEFTKPFVVHREIEVEPGAPLSQIDMLETQRNLYDLGIFSEVGIAVQNPEGGARDKNVLLQLREGPRYTFHFGVGLEVQTGALRQDPDPSTVDRGRTGVSPRFSFDVTRQNFRGRDHTITFRSRVGRLQQRVLLTYEAPRWFDNPDLKLAFITFFDTTRDVLTFTSERLEGSVQAQHILTRTPGMDQRPITSMFYRFTYRRVRARDLDPGFDPNEIPLITSPVRVGMPGFTFVRDRRNDPINATRGNYTTMDFGVASGVFGSETSFTKLSFQNSTYHPFGSNRYVLARSTQLGIQHNLGGGFIPFPERFFAGGSNMHRGFGINQAGPRDPNSGLPIGGGALFLNNLELRLPPVLLPFVDDNLSVTLFHDAGNVFSQPGDLLPSLVRFRQRKGMACGEAEPTMPCDYNYISHAVGAGLRYRTPIGPIRFDLGYNLNPPHLPRPGERLGRFNFFFSIGQTF
jgi:outer membrane protein insertion porin family